MPRIARIVGIDLPHHVTQRGNYQQNVFLDDSDRRQYLFWIEEYTKKYGVSIPTYCLMPNHVHFIAIPQREDSLAKTFNTAHMRYSQYFNKKLKIKGHLWQGRFYSCILDETHLISAARYIELNPVRAGIVKRPWEWQWSSALAHINQGEDALLTLKDLFEIVDMSSDSWESYLDTKEDRNFLDTIRKHTMTGWPLGSVAFIEKLGRKLNKDLRPLPRGRPKKDK